MKSMLKFTAWRDRGLVPAAFDALAAIHPDGLDREYAQFDCDLPMEDERVARILACLAEHGYRPWSGRTAMLPSEISLRIDRTYSRKDFDSASALELNPVSHIHTSGRRSEDGLMILESKELKAKARLSITGTYGLVASAEIKDQLEREGLVGLDFRPVILEGPARAVAAREGAYWELGSEIILPPMAPRMRFYHASSGDELAGNSPPPFVYREGHEFPAINSEPAEIHYLAGDWADAPPFDLARTRERPMGDHGVPIASPRLYRALAALRVPVAWVPVRID